MAQGRCVPGLCQEQGGSQGAWRGPHGEKIREGGGG